MKYPLVDAASVSQLPSCRTSRSSHSVDPAAFFSFSGADASLRPSHPFSVPIPVLGAGSASEDATVTEQWLLPGSPRWVSIPGGHILIYDGFLFGALSFPDSDDNLQQHTREAYDSIFAALKHHGHPFPIRFWNFMPRINAADAHGLERYRAFCAGRSQAFFDDIQAEEGFLPAGTGVGCAGGRVYVAFLATDKDAAVHLENPRQVPAYHYPKCYGPKSPSFARATFLRGPEQSGLLMMSGTASIIGHESQHTSDAVAQTRTTFDNIAELIHSDNLSRYHIPVSAPLQALQAVRVYVRHAHDLTEIRQIVLDRLGSLDQVTFLQADICRSELLVEIEGVLQIG